MSDETKITYRNTGVAYKPDTKFLGVHIIKSLKWTTHISMLRLQLSRMCYIIKSVQGIKGLGMIRYFYHSKYELLVRYGVIFWGADNESIPIFKLQKRVIQSMCGAKTGTPFRQLFKDFKIFKITSLYAFEVLWFLKKYKCSKQKKTVTVHDHNRRTNMDLHIKTYNTNLYKKSVINMGI